MVIVWLPLLFSAKDDTEMRTRENRSSIQDENIQNLLISIPGFSLVNIYSN